MKSALQRRNVSATNAGLRHAGWKKLFLDVGSGSGLFSLAARRLGAKVLSFDYDAESVALHTPAESNLFPWRS